MFAIASPALNHQQQHIDNLLPYMRVHPMQILQILSCGLTQIVDSYYMGQLHILYS